MLHELVAYAQREGLSPEPGFKAKVVRWLLVFSPDGQFLGVKDLRGDDRKSKGQEFSRCPDLTQREMVSAGNGCRHFLVDSLEVVCLLTKEGEPNEKQVEKHAYFVNLLSQAKDAVPVLSPIAAALCDEATLENMRAKVLERKAKPTDSATLAVTNGDGASIVVEGADWHTWWRAFRRSLINGDGDGAGKQDADPAQDGFGHMRCLLSGEVIKPAPSHNKIERLSDVGGLAMGDSLVSFDKDAFTSFGFEQGANAAMSEMMVSTYVAALNHLIRTRSRKLAGVKVVYWYQGPSGKRLDPSDDPMPEVIDGFGPPPDDGDDRDATADERLETARRLRAESKAGQLLNAIREGKRPDLEDAQYFALTLSANSGRVVVRDWMQGPFTELLDAVNSWFDDLSIIRRDGAGIVASHKFGAVLAAPVRELGDVTASTTAALWRCALRKVAIPHDIMAKTLQRVRLDIVRGETPLHARFGLLKAYCNRCNRNERTLNVNAELNECETDPAYLCGRIMAILAGIQRAALGDVGAGIVQRYYAAASATPALVLGRLVRLAQTGHLPKIGEKGLQFWFERQLAEAWARLDCRPPTILSLDGQTLFAMGYYQQIAKRYDKKQADVAADTAAEPVATN